MWIAIIIMGLLMIGYFVGQWLSKEYVQCVEAGPVIDVTADDLRRKSFYAPRVDLQKDGKAVSMRNMIRIVVNGDCMKPRHIVEGTQLYVEKVDKKADVKGLIHQGDILMLYLPDTKKYKIREFKEFTPEGAMNTFYYNADGSEHMSSQPHKTDTLIGVVKYRV